MNEGAGGIGVLGLLGVLFVGLKLTGHIDWSWWWVTVPFWAPFAVFLAAVAVLVPVYLVRGARRRNGWRA